MIHILALLLSGLIIFGNGCSITQVEYDDYWSDTDARIDEYVWDRDDTRSIPASLYKLCIDMVEEEHREMKEHGDEDIVEYEWSFNDDNTIGVRTIILTCSFEDHSHYISVTMGNY